MKKSIATWYKEQGIKITCRVKPKSGSVCDCGNLLNYKISPFMTIEKRVCPKCKRIHNVEDI